MTARPATRAQLERLTSGTDQDESWFVDDCLKDGLTYDQAIVDWEMETESRVKYAEENELGKERKESFTMRTNHTNTSGETFPQAVARFAAGGMDRCAAVRAARLENMARWAAYVEAANPGKSLNLSTNVE